jgi:divinyl protochlorophyllide a 8-vinyl-reductase
MSARADARIGPNAIIQVGHALEARHGRAVADALFAASGLSAYRTRAPAGMVPEAEVIALHAEIRRTLPAAETHAVAQAAGGATADYLLAHRIPRLAQRLLRVLPRRVAVRVLLAAISRHAWTFAGSGDFCVETGRIPAVLLRDCPLCRGAYAAAPACDYYATTFERLFGVLVDAHTRVLETECHAQGGDCCRFEIRIG